MKAKKCFAVLLIMQALFCLCNSSFAQKENVRRQIPIPSTKINPAFVGLNTMHVAIIPYDIELNDYILFWQEMKLNIERRLMSSGINRPAFQVNDYSMRTLDFPEILVEIHFYEVPNSTSFLFVIQTSVLTDIGYRRAADQFIRTKVWTIGTTIQIPSPAIMTSMVNNQVLEQVDQFTRAWHVANPQALRPADANDTGTALPLTPQNTTKTQEKVKEAAIIYVTSKNSKVFHKSDCSFARRIKAENLISYTSREQAVQMGKKPCSICKP